MNYRPLRVAKLIKEELGKLLLREIEPNGALLTITEVAVSKKLDSARVRVSILPENKSAAVLKMLKAAQHELQHMLLKKINIKPMPQILFEIDYGVSNAANVERLLKEE
jgi:ribosome-binding factor A